MVQEKWLLKKNLPSNFLRWTRMGLLPHLETTVLMDWVVRCLCCYTSNFSTNDNFSIHANELLRLCWQWRLLVCVCEWKCKRLICVNCLNRTCLFLHCFTVQLLYVSLFNQGLWDPTPGNTLSNLQPLSLFGGNKYSLPEGQRQMLIK